MTNFVSVATGAARYQDISMNPQKLAGQCAKLKCCINYEVDAYVEAQKRLPSREIPLETKDNTYFHFKTDIFKREITYSTDKSIAANLVTIPAQRVFDIINMNKKGIKPETLEADTKQQSKRESQDILGQESVTRFDNVQKKKKKKRGNGGATNASESVAEKAQPANNQPKQAVQPAKNAAPANEKKAEKPQEGKKPNAPSSNNNNNANNGNAAPKPQKNNNNRPKQKPKAAAPEKQVNGEKQPNTDKQQQQAKQPVNNKPANRPQQANNNKPKNAKKDNQ